uniref:AB hydrolase-1 domain-containing protein n=1 Tax=Acrobeloides nanus TaxID=290746 RepID=A0A914C2C3_9BILA
MFLPGNVGYNPNPIESIGNTLVSFTVGLKNFGVMASPILIPWAIRRLTLSSTMTWFQWLIFFHIVAYTTRSIGRLLNPEYRKFVNLLLEGNNKNNTNILNQLSLYDYQIYAAPPTFKASHRTNIWYVDTSEEEILRPISEPWNTIRSCTSYFMAHTIGRRMLYPGGLSLFNYMFSEVFVEKRRSYIIDERAQRNVILAEDGNRIDSMFFDRRNNKLKQVDEQRGSTLVICCDGNAGYYETGVMVTPLKMGYSVLGWNSPGFAESTGNPYPENILAAIESVMQLAIQNLGFKEEQIVVFGWSIGGFPATWVAANYPNIRGLILDATFDDLLPLAISRMPQSLGHLVQFTVRKHLNLPISKQLLKYHGPILIIRRSQDDIIVTEDVGSMVEKLASNRANHLLILLLKSRHPGLLNTPEDENIVHFWLARDPEERLSLRDDEFDDDDLALREDYTNISEDERNQIIYRLCDRYFLDFDAGHNVPLHEMYFNLPKSFP